MSNGDGSYTPDPIGAPPGQYISPSDTDMAAGQQFGWIAGQREGGGVRSAGDREVVSVTMRTDPWGDPEVWCRKCALCEWRTLCQ